MVGVIIAVAVIGGSIALQSVLERLARGMRARRAPERNEGPGAPGT